MDEYLNLIQIFFNEKHLFYSDKQYKNCIDCKKHKQFIEKSNEVIFNCGEDGKSKCGVKIRIILPKYIKDLSTLKNELDNMINWEVIGKFIDIDPSLIKNNISKKEEYDKELDKLNDLFIKFVRSNKIDIINKNYNQIIKELKPDLNNIISELYDESLSDQELKEKKQDYIRNTIRINELYNEIKSITSEYYIHEGNIEISNNTHEYLPFTKPDIVVNDYRKESPSPKKKTSKKQTKPDGKKLLENGTKVKFSRGNKTYEGVIEDKTANSYKICCKPGKKSGEKQSTWLVKHEDVSIN